MGKLYTNEEVEITSLEFPNKGIGEWNGERVTIKNTIPGQRVLADIKRKKRRYEGRLREIIKKAEYEIQPACPAFGSCGGCTYQSIEYSKELEYKKQMVLKLLADGGIDGFEFGGIVPSPSPMAYRNKMEFSFGDNGKDGELCLGMRKRNSNYEVNNADCCTIVHKDISRVLSCVLEFFRATDEKFYHKMRHTGTLRHLLVRRAHFTGEMLVNIVTTSNIKTNLAPLAAKLLSLKLDGRIVGISHIINDGVADVVRADSIEWLYGEGFITEHLLGLSFKISTFSFFQTNSEGAEVLYSVVRDFAGESKDKIIFDLYCGTGTITQILSKNAKRVVGIELVEEAVEAAKKNAAFNGITNCEFIVGDVLKKVDELADKPDTIILDPPREGINPRAIEKIIAFGAPRLVYISCKASSLAKDLALLEQGGYHIDKIKCVDMFPRTFHTETVCALSRN